MKLLILSDFHIGTDPQTATFGWKTKQFIREIDDLRQKYSIDKVILNGDVYELYHNTFESIEENNPKIVNYLRGDDFFYIKGNHDAVNNFGSYAFDVINSTGKRIHIEHGHNADLLSGTRIGRSIGRASFHVLKLILKIEMFRNIYFRFIERLDNVNRIPKKYDSVKYLTYALNLLKSYDVVILGHTHKMEVHKTYYLNHRKMYINCGSCSLGRMQSVILDTETLKYKTIKNSKKDIKRKNKTRKFGKIIPNELVKIEETKKIHRSVLAELRSISANMF